ncbi:MAG: TolC family protein [Candidatus Latescibacteria bacterium]|nr:TolC family protein [Candidatus Latescibacterota bacterium]
MSLRRHLSLCILSALLAGVPARAQQDTLRLTLGQAIALAVDYHLGLRSARLSQKLQEGSVAQEQARFGRTLTASLTNQSNRSPSISRLEGVQTSTSNSIGLGLGLSQDLATGGRFSLNFSNNRSSNNAAFNTIDPVYRSGLSLSFNQPLLQGRGWVNRIGLRVARNSLTASELVVQGQIQDLRAEVSRTYWDLSMAVQNLQLREQFLAAAQRVLETAKVRAAVGSDPASNILQAEVGVAQRQQDIVSAQASLRQAEDQLKTLLGLDQDPQRWQLPLQAIDTPAVAAFEGDPDSGLARTLAFNPSYRRAQLDLKSTELQIALARDQTRPSVALSTQVGLSGIGGSYSDDIKGLKAWDGRSWQGSVNLDFPLGENGAEIRLQQQLIQKEQRQVELERLRLQLAQQVRNQHRQVETSRQREEAARWTERLSVQNLDELEERLNLGLTTVRQVLDAQDDLAQARLSRLQALIDYNKALIEWRRLTGE